MSLFRVPARALFLANLGAAVLAGLGVQTIAERLAEPQRLAAVCRALRRVHRPHARGALSLRERAPARAVFPGQLKPPAGCSTTIDSGSPLAACSGLLVLGSLPFSAARGPRWAGRLIGLLALCELGWYGCSLLQVAPAEQFLGADPISAAIQQLESGFRSRRRWSNQGAR